MRFLFQIFQSAKRSIKLCYVQIGWLVTGSDLLYFSANKSHEGKGDSVGKRSESGKEIVFGKYEPKANSNDTQSRKSLSSPTEQELLLQLRQPKCQSQDVYRSSILPTRRFH